MLFPEEQVLAANSSAKQINELTCPVFLRCRLLGAGVAVSTSRLRFCSIHSNVPLRQQDKLWAMMVARLPQVQQHEVCRTKCGLPFLWAWLPPCPQTPGAHPTEVRLPYTTRRGFSCALIRIAAVPAI